MSKVVHFPTADRRQQVKTDKDNEIDIYDYLAPMVDECGIHPEHVFKPENLAIACKAVMEDARRARDQGRMNDYKHLDELAWQIRSKNDEITEILYAEGFLQEHGIF